MTGAITDRRSARGGAATAGRAGGFTSEDPAAMKARGRERGAEVRGNAGGEAGLLARADRMPAAGRDMARHIHALVMAAAAGLQPRTGQGMPAWARDARARRLLQGAGRFDTRYASCGFSDQAALDKDGGQEPSPSTGSALPGPPCRPHRCAGPPAEPAPAPR
ncbi:hypothetical protein GXB84_16680 [Stenotrophomonas acidaminiphila]|uniref:hypothetical protein n=1 Tax=Stenotrophomonas acidaminiphila TaxID=128780 RepID=UPI00137613B0|nr:hypothetical protein [Stenotrophomonas acidaminiphila]NCT88952.1 hypothetical protein [Stenotrophomonas acidaminiphila]